MARDTKVEYVHLLCAFTDLRKPFRKLFLTTFRGIRGVRG